jgi:hypothetical protein
MARISADIYSTVSIYIYELYDGSMLTSDPSSVTVVGRMFVSVAIRAVALIST